MDDITRQLDEALERLLNGEELSLLQREYPAHANELASYAIVRTEVARAAAFMPSEDSLRRALSSMRITAAVAEPTTNTARISWFFATYRTALVVPVLVLMLVATGAVMRPATEPTAEPVVSLEGGEPVATDATASEARFAVTGTESATAADAPSQSMMLMKTAPNVPPTPMPEDQELASVFSDEMQHDRSEAEAAQSESAVAFDDSDSLSGYENTYDAEML